MEAVKSINQTETHLHSEHETKFVLNNSASGIMLRWLQARCRPDPQFEAAIVSSIYYDTSKWKFLREKINSDYLKTKVRLRWYADIETREPQDDSYIEAKYKRGSRRAKVRIKTGISGKWLSRVNLDNLKLLKVPHLLRNNGIIIAGHLIPVFTITYKRRRFIEIMTGARLSIDYDISAPCVNRQVLTRQNPARLQNAVFELKGNLTELPDVLTQLTALGCRKESFSKYLNCYKNIMTVSF